MAADRMCIGMFGQKEQRDNPATTVCNDNQIFFLVKNQTEWDWGAKATNQHHFDAVCGLGKEKASASAKGWIARGV